MKTSHHSLPKWKIVSGIAAITLVLGASAAYLGSEYLASILTGDSCTIAGSTEMVAGETKQITINFQNNSGYTLAGSGLRLLNSDGLWKHNKSVSSGNSVAPGASRQVTTQITAPSIPAVYPLNFSLYDPASRRRATCEGATITVTPSVGAQNAVSYEGMILDIPRLPSFGGFTSEGGSFIPGIVYTTDVEWLPGSDSEGYFVVTTSVAEQDGPNAYRFGLWVFSDEGEQLAQIDIEEEAGNPMFGSSASHLASRNAEVRIFGDDVIAMETHARNGQFQGGLYFYRIGGANGASLIGDIPGGGSDINIQVRHYGDDYVLTPDIADNGAYSLYRVPSLEKVRSFSLNPFLMNGASNRKNVQISSIGNYMFFSNWRAVNNNNTIAAAYKLSDQGITEESVSFTGDTFVVEQGEDWDTGGKWALTGGTGNQPQEYEKISLLVPKANGIEVAKEFSTQSRVFGDLFSLRNKTYINGLSGTADLLAVTATIVNPNVFGNPFANGLFLLDKKNNYEPVLTAGLNEHRIGGAVERNPDGVAVLRDSALAPNGMLAVTTENQVHLYKIENIITNTPQNKNTEGTEDDDSTTQQKDGESTRNDMLPTPPPTVDTKGLEGKAQQTVVSAAMFEVPAGYAPPQDPESGTTIVEIGSDAEGMTIDIPAENTFVYDTGYHLEDGEWKPFSFSGPIMKGDWIAGGANASIVLDSLEDEGNVIVFVCSRTASGIVCGKQRPGQPSSESYWTIQRYIVENN